MRRARLELALETGALVLPDSGQIAVWRPVTGDDLSLLPRDRVTVLTGFRPDHDHFTGLGYATTSAPPYAAGLVCLPRARALAHALLTQAMAQVAPGGPVVLDGAKTDGIEGVLRDLRAAGVQVDPPLSKAHGKLAVMRAGQALPADWFGGPRALPNGFWTAPGVFSADGPDPGSLALVRALPSTLPPRMADLGAGWGFLTRAVLDRPGVRHVDAVEAEADALDCARRAIADPRVAFHWADVRTFRPATRWDGVVMNPPFHQGRTADPDLGLGFLRAAAAGLTGEGRLWLVANRQLPYEAALAQLFRKVEPLAQDGVYKVMAASGPRRER